MNGDRHTFPVQTTRTLPPSPALSATTSAWHNGIPRHRALGGLRASAPRPQVAARLAAMSQPLYAVCPYGVEAGSTRVRLQDWFTHLGQEPIWVDYRGRPSNAPVDMLRHPVSTARAEMVAHRLDTRGATVVMSREASPVSTGRLEARLLSRAAHSTYDIDDALFADTSRWRRAMRMPDKIRRAVASADVVVAGNTHLADWASRYHADVRIIPSCVEPSHYERKTSWDISSPPQLVWLGSPPTEAFLATVADALLEVHRRTGARLRLVSGAADNPALAALRPMTTRVPWSVAAASRELAGADVALAPLPDTAYTRGKCAYKILQYAAAGLPVVGSPVGANQLALRRLAGHEATTSDEWVDQLLTVLAMSSPDRAADAQGAWLQLDAHYSFAAWSSAWQEAVFADVVPGIHP